MGFRTSCRQLWLMTSANFRISFVNSKFWMLEMGLPLLLMTAAFTPPFSTNGEADIETVDPFEAVPLKGSTDDFKLQINYIQSLENRFCSRDMIKLAYYSQQDSYEVDHLMKEVGSHYTGFPRLIAILFASEKEFMATLKADIADHNAELSFCETGSFIGGVVFNELNTTTNKLDYRFVMPPITGNGKLKEWSLYKTWIEPYGFMEDVLRLPTSPPYWISGFATLQFAIDSAFLKSISTSNDSSTLRTMVTRLPEPSYSTSIMLDMVEKLPIFLAVATFFSILNTTLHMSHEIKAVKKYLSVIGLSSTVFYLSHIIVAVFKCSLVVIPCALVLKLQIERVDLSLIIVVCYLFVVGIVVLGVLIATIFRDPTSSFTACLLILSALIGQVAQLQPNEDNRKWQFLSSLNIYQAFYFICQAMVYSFNRDDVISFGTMFCGTEFHFPVGWGLVMLAIDILWMLMAIIGAEWMLSGVDETVYYFLQIKFRALYRSFWAPEPYREHREARDPEASRPLTPLREADSHKNIGIFVAGVSKKWGAMKTKALDGIELRAWKNEATILLGHNGAGKSTLFSIIAGMVSPSEGMVYLDGKPLVKDRHCEIGLCPQENALIDKLTVEQNLRLFHGLKGKTDGFAEEADRLLEAVGLTQQRNKLARDLSGGMKRKLCVCLALIGGSKVILLDEPTAGMDPGARRDVEKLLEMEKKDRTILISTHYMDEAERIGDKVAIMSEGKMRECASPQQLKLRYGHVATVDLVNSKYVQPLLNEVHKLMPTAYVRRKKERQIELVLPGTGDVQILSRCFHLLEEREMVEGYSVSLCSLEEVYMKVADINGTNFLSSNDYFERANERTYYTGWKLFISRLMALITMRLQYQRRHWLPAAVQLAICFYVIYLIHYLSMDTIDYQTAADTRTGYNSSMYWFSRVLTKYSTVNEGLSSAYRTLVEAMQPFKVINMDDKSFWVSQVVALPRQLPANSLGVVLEEESANALFSSRALHSFPISMNMLSNARLLSQNKTESGYIHTSLMALASKARLNPGLPKDLIFGLLAPVIVLTMVFYTSSCISFPVEERRSKFDHQQSLVGVSRLTVRLAYTVFDLFGACALAAIICGLMWGMFTAPAIFYYRIWIVCVLYVFSTLPFIYLLSQFFSSPTRAHLIMILWQLVAGLTAFFAVKYTLPNAFIAYFCKAIFPSDSLSDLVWSYTIEEAMGVPCSDTICGQGENLAIFLYVGCAGWILLFVVSSNWNAFLRCCSKEIVSPVPLVAKNICKYYGRDEVVKNLNLEVKEGECVGLLGVNGAGKTTSFEILTGSIKPDCGSVIIMGVPVNRANKIGYCPQFDGMLLDLSGREILMFIARLHGSTDAGRLTEDVINAVGMKHRENKIIRSYSGGERRRISIAMAIICPVSIVILDEPTAGIDAVARRCIWSILSEILKTRKCGILMTSHSMHECEELCTRIAVMDRGFKVDEGSSQYLKTKHGKFYLLSIFAKGQVDKNDILKKIMKNVRRDAPILGEMIAVFKGSHLQESLILRWKIPYEQNVPWSILYAECIRLTKDLPVEFCLEMTPLEDLFLKWASDSKKREENQGWNLYQTWRTSMSRRKYHKYISKHQEETMRKEQQVRDLL